MSALLLPGDAITVESMRCCKFGGRILIAGHAVISEHHGHSLTSQDGQLHPMWLKVLLYSSNGLGPYLHLIVTLVSNFLNSNIRFLQQMQATS